MIRAIGLRFVAESAQRAVPLIVMPLMLRYWGSAGYGVQVQFDNLRAMAMPVACLGLGVGLVRACAGRIAPVEVGRYFLTVALLSLASAGALVAAGWGLAPWIQKTFIGVPGIDGALRLSLFLIPVGVAESLVNDLSRARLRIPAYSVTQIAGTLVGTAGVFAVIRSGGGLAGVIGVWLVVKTVGVSALLLYLLRAGEMSGPAGLLPTKSWGELLANGWPLTVLSFLTWGLALSDRWVLGAFRDAVELGHYGAVCNAMFLLAALAVPFWGPMYPVMAHRMAVDGPAAAERACRSYVNAYALLAAPAWVGLVVLGPALFEILTGRAWAVSRGLFAVLGAGVLLDQLSAPIHYLFYISNKARPLVGVLAGLLVVNVVGNLAGVPRWGLYAAGTMTLVTYGLELAILWRMARRADWNPRALFGKPLVGKAAASAALMGAGLLAAGLHAPRTAAGLAVAVGAGAAFYALVLTGCHGGRVGRVLQAVRA